MSRPASLAAATGAQVGVELRLTARRGENVLAILVIPVVVLVFFATVAVLPTSGARPVDRLLPGALALAIIATGLVNLGIATAYERSYGVLKRLGGSPLTRGGLVAAKLATVLIVEVLQVGLLLLVATLLDWRPGPAASVVALALVVVVGTAAFAGLGMAMAGALRAEATLALANGLFLAFLLLGGIIVPITELPGALGIVAAVLPSAALAEAFRAALGEPGIAIGPPLLVLAAWALAALVVAIRTFRWD